MGKFVEFLAGALPQYQNVMGKAQEVEANKAIQKRQEEAYNQLQEQMKGNKDFAKQLYTETVNSGMYSTEQLAELPDYNGFADPETYLNYFAQWKKKADTDIAQGKVDKKELERSQSLAKAGQYLASSKSREEGYKNIAADPEASQFAGESSVKAIGEGIYGRQPMTYETYDFGDAKNQAESLKLSQILADITKQEEAIKKDQKEKQLLEQKQNNAFDEKEAELLATQIKDINNRINLGQQQKAFSILVRNNHPEWKARYGGIKVPPPPPPPPPPPETGSEEEKPKKKDLSKLQVFLRRK